MPMALTFPPIPAAFLALFGPNCNIVWENPCMGAFGVVVTRGPGASGTTVTHERLMALLADSAAASVLPEAAEFSFDVPSDLVLPQLPPETRAAEPPCCLHGRPAVRRIVTKKLSPNIGRAFYACAWMGNGRCGFFRWADELDQFSEVRLGEPMSAAEVVQETASVSPELQLRAWRGTEQGSSDWHRMRRCRLTASNFGSVHNNNQFQGPTDMLRSLLWPASFDSSAMKYGSVNEKVALLRLSEFLAVHGANPALPTYVDEPGIWLCAEPDFLS